MFEHRFSRVLDTLLLRFLSSGRLFLANPLNTPRFVTPPAGNLAFLLCFDVFPGLQARCGEAICEGTVAMGGVFFSMPTSK